MQPRIDYPRAAPEAFKALLGVERALASGAVDHALLHLVKLLASQINGCAYCIDMHWKDAKALGETDQRLYGLDAWRESPYYTDRERAALEWTESLTNVAQTHAPDDTFEALRPHFSEREISELTIAVGIINAWNRIAIGMRSTPGSYQPPKARQPATT